MWIEIENRIKVLDNRINDILNTMPDKAYAKIDREKEIPLLSHLENEDYINLKTMIIDLRTEIITFFTQSSPESRVEISNSLIKYENFGLVFTPNAGALNKAIGIEDSLLNVLYTVSIQNLNDDIRELIVFMNSLKKLARENEIDFSKLLTKVIEVSSDIPTIYSIAMMDFFQNFQNGESIPIKVR